MKNTKFTLLQYNVQKSQSVQELLLATPTLQEVDIIALQELWKNPHLQTSTSTVFSSFLPLYSPEIGRTLFLINKNLNLSSLHPTFWSKDFVSLEIHLENTSTSLWVHNLYFTPSSQENYLQASEALLCLLQNALQAKGQHILLTDSNLHHPDWSKKRRLYSDTAHKFQTLMKNSNLELAIAPFTPTRARSLSHKPCSPIDLSFISSSLSNSLIFSKIALQFFHGSDHRPVLTSLDLDSPRKTWKPERNWKTLDTNLAKQECNNLQLPFHFQDKHEVDEYLEYLNHFLQEIADRCTELQKQSSHSVPWWNQEIQTKVKQERRIRRQVLRGQASQEELEEATKLKKKAVREGKQNTFRKQVHELASPSKFWKLAKWGKSKANKTPDLPLVPDLETQEGLAKSFEEKTKSFSAQFFPEARVPEPSTESHQSTPEIQLSQEVTTEEVEQILNKKKPFTAGGKDKLPNGFLKALGPKFCQAIAVLTSTCWRLEYFPEKFKNAKTVCLRKPGKGIYNQAKAWRPIALLNTTGKLMEAITAARLSKVAEKAKLLPEIQMGFRKGRSTESALFLLTSQVEKVWKEGMVASLLSLDISGAYDRVLPEILQKILERKGIPLWLTSWIFSFCTRRTTTLVFDDSESSSIPIHCGVPQGSPLSPILFLFYISELHETVHSPTTGVSALGFADDTNLLAFGHSLKSNLLKLKNTHLKCLSWAARHGIVFSPEKYEILHFSRRRSDNLQLKLRLGNVILKPKEEVRVLGVYLDAKLHWHKHQRIILQKAQKALSSLSRTSYSTWGFPVLTARLVYTAILRSVLSYAVGIWFNPLRKSSNISSLIIFQNKCLRLIGGAFKATPSFLLESELFLLPLDLYFKFRTACFLSSIQTSSLKDFLDSTFATISSYASSLRKPLKKSSTISSNWKFTWLSQITTNQASSKKELQILFTKEWENQWEEKKRKGYTGWQVFCQKPHYNNLKLYKELQKAEASLLLQTRTGRIGLASFLFRAGVPDFPTPLCMCGQAEETVKHITSSCSLYSSQRQHALFNPQDFTTIISNPELLQKFLYWFMSLKRLNQFNLAFKLHYSHSNI